MVTESNRACSACEAVVMLQAEDVPRLKARLEFERRPQQSHGRVPIEHIPDLGLYKGALCGAHTCISVGTCGIDWLHALSLNVFQLIIGPMLWLVSGTVLKLRLASCTTKWRN